MLHPHSVAFAVRYAGTATAASSNTHKKISEIRILFCPTEHSIIRLKKSKKQNTGSKLFSKFNH